MSLCYAFTGSYIILKIINTKFVSHLMRLSVRLDEDENQILDCFRDEQTPSDHIINQPQR